MTDLIARQKVADFTVWKDVFDSYAEPQREAGLRVERVLRNLNDPNDVWVWFEITDLERARAFVTSPGVPEAKRQPGVIGETELCFLA